MANFSWRIDQTNVPLGGSASILAAAAFRAHGLQRQSGDHPSSQPPSQVFAATTWNYKSLRSTSATHRTTPGAAAAANPCRQSISPTTSSPP